MMSDGMGGGGHSAISSFWRAHCPFNFKDILICWPWGWGARKDIAVLNVCLVGYFDFRNTRLHLLKDRLLCS